MNRILALVDGSTYSQSVCDHTGWVASHTDASVLLCHVMKSRNTTTDNNDLSGSIGLGARSALLGELAEMDRLKASLLKKRGRAILEDAAQRVTSFGSVEVSEMLRYGQFIESVIELESDVDLLVIGKRGETSHIDMEHLGSNLERVVRSTSKPVLVASREYSQIKKVLVAFDGGRSVLRAIDYMASPPLFQELEIELVEISDKQTHTAIDEATAQLTNRGLNASAKVLQGQPDKVIAETVKNGNFDMLIMGAYGHSRIRHLIIGSTTTQMVRKCRVPILLLR